MYSRVWILLAVLAAPLGGAGDAALDRATLRGVGGINVIVDTVPAELRKAGVTADEMRNRMEELLRHAGLKVDAASNEFLALHLTSVRAARGPFAVAATIGLYQPVTLVRDAKVKTATQTWEADTIALADDKQVFRACMDSVDELSKRFLAAYQSVNPAGTGGR